MEIENTAEPIGADEDWCVLQACELGEQKAEVFAAEAFAYFGDRHGLTIAALEAAAELLTARARALRGGAHIN